MNLFYTPDIDDSFYTLNEAESLHCTRVMRLRIGNEIYLTNGKGDLFQARIVDDNNKKCSIEVVEIYKEYGKRNYSLHIAIAPTKNIDRIEWFLEKATEIGIDEITPLICEHSERRSLNIERLGKVVTAAMKQSLKAYHPSLNSEMKFVDFIARYIAASKYIAFCNGNNAKLKDQFNHVKNVVLLIGPEGDFSDAEIQMSLENGYTPVSLGSSRYRTETAALVACHTISLLNE